MIWIGTFYGMVNDPEASGFDTGAESDVEIAHPDVITTAQLLMLVLCFPIAGHITDRIKTADRRVLVMSAGTVALLVTSIPLFSHMLNDPTTGACSTFYFRVLRH